MNTTTEIVSDSRAAQYRAILDRKVAEGAQRAMSVIETIHRDAPKDQIASTRAISFDGGEMGLAVRLPNDSYVPSDFAIGQLAEKAAIPTAYLRDLAGGSAWQRKLAAHALTESYRNRSAERVLIRSVGGTLRGVLSDRFRRLDSRPLVDALAAEAKAIGAVPIGGEATETRVALKLVMPAVIEPVPGEFLVYGGEWSNSDFGNGTHSFRAFALRVACLNGMTAENLLRQIHLGGKLSEDFEFSERTLRLDTETSVSMLRDVVRGALGPGGRERMTGKIVAASQNEMSAASLASNGQDPAEGDRQGHRRRLQVRRRHQPAGRQHRLAREQRDLVDRPQHRRRGDASRPRAPGRQGRVPAHREAGELGTRGPATAPLSGGAVAGHSSPGKRVDTMAERGTKKTIYEWYLVVEGAGSFPVDMLRYDSAHPFEQADAAKLEHHHHERRRVVVRRLGLNEGPGTAPRWQSFGWIVVLATTDSGEARRTADHFGRSP